LVYLWHCLDIPVEDLRITTRNARIMAKLSESPHISLPNVELKGLGKNKLEGKSVYNNNNDGS
jgi:hypothetical protein